jgi:GntR family transcriptional regulator
MVSLIGQHPRYLQLAQTLLNEIQAGRYPVGALLPTEFALCEQFGTSRFTVREAVKQLVQMGLVTRQAGVGTRVIATSPNLGYRQVMRDLTDLRQYTAETALDILETDLVEIGGGLPTLLRAQAGELWLRVAGLRRTDAAQPPICFTEVYIHPAFRSLQGLAGQSHTPIYVLIEQQFGEHIAEVTQEIRAVSLGAKMAKVLGAKPQSPALWVCRHYINRKKQVVEVAISTHPADRFTYSQTFQRDWQAS